MSRQSAFRGTWQPNRRPYVTLSPDAYVSIQGETTVVGCGECRRKVDLNRYVTSISTEAAVDSAPGGATVVLSIPDTDVNDFFVDGQLLIVPMMEIELYSKGYFLVGGFPQYYRIFWGIVSSVTKAWSNGTTTVTISCKDILRWWELTNVTINPGFIESFGSSTGNFTFWGNQFAGMNPYTVIIALAREAMGDFSLTTGSFTSFLPEKGPEEPVVGGFARDIMAYWQLKFGNIWNSLVMYGASGQAYTFSGDSGTFSPVQISERIFAEEERLAFVNQETGLFKINPGEVATFKQSIDRAVDFELFQSEQQSKLALAMSSRDQAGYEFFCDPCGDIVFKPPFYNLNVMPNKPVSWIQDFEVLDDSVTDSEAEVYTHITASGNAFGGVMDYGLNDEITTPRAGAFDFHLLRRYGWRKYDYQCEWAGNPRKLFFHLLDYLDKLNAKRQNGTVTIPLRPELRLGFPIWFPKYDSFFYVTGISHSYQVGGQATTTLTLSAKRSKFIAPNNIGELSQTGVVKKTAKVNAKGGVKTYDYNEAQWSITFPDAAGASTSLTQADVNGSPVVLRDPKTGKTLGYPNAVMVFRTSHKGDKLAEIITGMGQQKPAKSGPGGKDLDASKPPGYKYQDVIGNVFKILQSEQKNELIQRLRAHRYEAGVTNAGAYDYALDKSRTVKELILVPVSRVDWPKVNQDTSPGAPTYSGTEGAATVAGKTDKEKKDAVKAGIEKQVKDQEPAVKAAKAAFEKAAKELKDAEAKLKSMKAPAKKPAAPPAKKPPGYTGAPSASPPDVPVDSEVAVQAALVDSLRKSASLAAAALKAEQDKLAAIKANKGSLRLFSDLNMMIRPVSDEFGFEVIGHYRYGRGAFIDRGQVQVKIQDGDAERLVNQLNIQFAPSGGFLTDGPSGTNLDPSAVSINSSLERMQPEDYVTGASFKGYSTKGGVIQEVMLTSQSTYTNLVNANVGRGVYVEADSLRRARTLGELSPTLASGVDAVSVPCGCSLSTPRWLGYMPREFVDRVLNKAANSPLVQVKQESSSTTSGLDGKTKADIDSANAKYDKLAADRKAKLAKDAKALQDKYEKGKLVKAKKSDSSKAVKAKSDAEAAGKGAEDPSLTEDPYVVYMAAYNELTASYQKDLDTIEASRTQELALMPKTGAALTDSGKTGGDIDVVRGSTYSDFFSILTDFLQKEARSTYESSNLVRERSYTLGDREITVPDDLTGVEQDNVLGQPGGSLFSRAAQGDASALKSIQSEANFNFGSTVEASKRLSSARDSASSGKASGDQPFATPLVAPVVGVSAIGQPVQPSAAASPVPSKVQLDAIAAMSPEPRPAGVLNPGKRTP